MILVDTNVWIQYLRKENEDLLCMLNKSSVVMHPFVMGEIALGNLSRNSQILPNLKNLPMLPVATDAEFLFFIQENRLMGIGYVDAHLLLSTKQAKKTCLWTLDTKLKAAASALDLSYER